MNTSPEPVGVLGLGIIGSVWAGHLEADGVLGATWNRTPRPEAPRGRDNPAGVARAAETLIVVVADPPAVESVLSAMRPALTARHLVIQSSTIDPDHAERFSRMVRETGAAYLEAPFTGSKPAAEQRNTVFYMGGSAAAVARAEPVLKRLSQHRFHVGTEAQAATLKLACNLMIAAQMEALCEALAWARRAGIDDAIFFDALRQNASWSGLAALKEAKLRAGDTAPQFSVKHMLKDIRLATAAAALPLGEAVRDRLQLAAERGWADEDISALMKNLV